MTSNFIGARIKAMREERRLSQDDLARLFGFKDRQTVSAIETGERRVTEEELVLAVERLGATLHYFTEPSLLVGEGRFSLLPRAVGAPRRRRRRRGGGGLRWLGTSRQWGVVLLALLGMVGLVDGRGQPLRPVRRASVRQRI